MLKNMNKKLIGSSVTHSDAVSVGDCIHMYYLFGESYVNLDMKILEDVKRDPTWPQTLLLVIKKSNALLCRNKISAVRGIGVSAESSPLLGKNHKTEKLFLLNQHYFVRHNFCSPRYSYGNLLPLPFIIHFKFI